jgi:GH25 family lysozyme M1 (1,4-beta-N-acetylmuramidase)
MMIEPVVDVSKWQGEIDAKKMIAAGTLGIYMKAGGVDKNNGSSYTDSRFRENASKFGDLLPCGFYYFFYPHFSGADQAEYFCNLLKSVKWNLPPAIDVESNPNNVSQGKTQKEIRAFLDKIEEELNVKGVVYTRASFWNPNVGSPKWGTDYKLWIARYGEGLKHPWDNKDTSSLRPKPWTDYWLWQYSADKNRRGKEFGASSKDIDVNRVNMTREEFFKFANWEDQGEKEKEGGPVDVTPPPDVKVEYPHKGFLRRGYSQVNVRSTPTTSQDNVVGSIRRGYEFTVYKEHKVEDDLWWLVEMPNGTVGWGARRYNGISYLEHKD